MIALYSIVALFLIGSMAFIAFCNWAGNVNETTAVILISLILVGITPLVIPITLDIDNYTDSYLEFGFPLTFVRQANWLETPRNVLPKKAYLLLDIWDNPTQVIWTRFFGSIAVVTMGLQGIIAAVKKATCFFHRGSVRSR